MTALPDSHFPSPSESRSGCRYCGGAGLRRSRLRTEDLPRLVLLQWPVRCLHCSKRQYVLWSQARKALSSSMPHAPELKMNDSWRNFTIRVNRTPSLFEHRDEDNR